MSNETITEYVFSLWDDGDDWYEEIEDALDNMDTSGESRVQLYMGTVRRFAHVDLIDVESDIIENMQDRAYEEAGDNADAYLTDIPKEKFAELQRVVSEWLDANVQQPQFYAVEHIVEIEVQLDCDGKYVSHRVADRPTEG